MYRAKSFGASTGPSVQFATSIHTDQIRNYLPMLNDKAIQLIVDSQEKTDSIIPIYGRQFDNAYHFDNNKLLEATKKINEGYKAMLSDFRGKPSKIMDYFGRITHALQDFYSHSNWLELSFAGYTGHQRLLDESYDLFSELKPLSTIGKTRIVSLEKGFKDPITQWGRVASWQVDSKSYVVSGVSSTGARVGGLMTGEVNGVLYGQGNSVPITDPITNVTYQGFNHGGLAGTITSNYLGPLAKDTIKDRYHQQALELARDQVQHEFVRMLGLIQSRYGNDGLRKFSQLFVNTDKQDEFEVLVKQGALTRQSLVKNQSLNSLSDNEGNDLVIKTFFAGANPDVKPVPEKTTIPSELLPYAKQVEAGQFRWTKVPVASSVKPANQTPGSLGNPEAELQVLIGGRWTGTGFVSSQFDMHR